MSLMGSSQSIKRSLLLDGKRQLYGLRLVLHRSLEHVVVVEQVVDQSSLVLSTDHWSATQVGDNLPGTQIWQVSYSNLSISAYFPVTSDYKNRR